MQSTAAKLVMTKRKAEKLLDAPVERDKGQADYSQKRARHVPRF